MNICSIKSLVCALFIISMFSCNESKVLDNSLDSSFNKNELEVLANKMTDNTEFELQKTYIKSNDDANKQYLVYEYLGIADKSSFKSLYVKVKLNSKGQYVLDLDENGNLRADSCEGVNCSSCKLRYSELHENNYCDCLISGGAPGASYCNHSTGEQTIGRLKIDKEKIALPSDLTIL